MKQEIKQLTFSFHPILFAIFPVISLLSENMHLLLPSEIFFPIFLFVIITISIWTILYLIFKNIVKTSLITSLSLFLFFAYGHFSSIVYDLFFQETTFKEHLVLLSIFLGVIIIISRFIIKSKHSLHNASLITTIIGISILIFPIMMIATYSSEQTSFIADENTPIFSSMENSNEIQKPDIYLIVLDSYPDEKILNNLFDFDNSDFISFLSSKNFIIPEKTFSHYHTSFLTITSLLNLDYINHLTVDVGENSKNRFQAYKMIDQNKIMKITKSQGYVNVNIDSGWEATRYISSADLNLCGKNQFLNSQTIVMMIKNSMLNPVYVKIFESDYRDRITCSFNSISTIHNETKQPVFVFAHIFLPHGPYYWGPDGEYNVPTKATLEGFHKDKIGFTDQLQFTNKKVKEFVTKILDESKTPPIIILFSDHGTMLTYDDHISEDFILERMSNIMYVHLPENNLESLNNNLSSINLLRMISNDHLNQKFSYLEDKYYFSDDEKPYRWLDITNFLLKNKKIDLDFFN
ncbi:MAG: hypothetical protein CL712_05945 [Chloroflexi bacterium]|nr:hypothetical protein [Chloroflexota bacterium]